MSFVRWQVASQTRREGARNARRTLCTLSVAGALATKYGDANGPSTTLPRRRGADGMTRLRQAHMLHEQEHETVDGHRDELRGVDQEGKREGLGVGHREQ